MEHWSPTVHMCVATAELRARGDTFGLRKAVRTTLNRGLARVYALGSIGPARRGGSRVYGPPGGGGLESIVLLARRGGSRV